MKKILLIFFSFIVTVVMSVSSVAFAADDISVFLNNER